MSDERTAEDFAKLIEMRRAQMTMRLPNGKGCIIKTHKNAPAYDLLEACDFLTEAKRLAEERAEKAERECVRLREIIEAKTDEWSEEG